MSRLDNFAALSFNLSSGPTHAGSSKAPTYHSFSISKHRYVYREGLLSANQGSSTPPKLTIITIPKGTHQFRAIFRLKSEGSNNRIRAIAVDTNIGYGNRGRGEGRQDMGTHFSK